MTFAAALGRVGQIESTLFTVSARHHPPATSPATTTSPSLQHSAGSDALAASSALASETTQTSGASEFDALMRVLAYAEQLAAPGAPSFSGSALSGSSASLSGSHLGREQVTGATAAEAVRSPESSRGAAAVATAGPAPAPAQGGGEQLVSNAKKYLGVPYVWGGNNPRVGLDCSGLVKLALGEMGVSMPRVAIDQARMGREIPSLDQARPGDLIVTHAGGHIGIYVGEGQMIHAPRPGRSVAIDQVSHVSDSRGIMTIRRVVAEAENSEVSMTGDGAVTASESRLDPPAAAEMGALQRDAFEAGLSSRTAEGDRG